jgi:hypothetical protein
MSLPPGRQPAPPKLIVENRTAAEGHGAEENKTHVYS